ncbi:DEAD/DEAH box helicase [Scrofimicrobium sp. R131]|uniref:DUF3516 domain-containing protein n=1 Tax=Scrofimicrobium appendicitidis TaxID=3079930 RepID=A0AAU7V875_9ACTO
MKAPLNELLDQLEDSGEVDSPDALFDAFSQWADSTGRPLYPHQEEALLELLAGNHVVAQTPTGSGKSMMALAGHFLSLARGGRSYYTAPLKALVSEKFFDLVEAFGAANVGMITGDISLNSKAPIICCTAEILANQSLREGAALDTDLVIMDEFHFYSDPQRGWAWQVPLLELTKPQFVLLSATLGDMSELAEDLAERTERTVGMVTEATRPVPLEFEYCLDELPVVVERLLAEDRAPIYIVHFAQREAVNTAKGLQKLSILSKEQKAELKEALRFESFGRGFGQTLRELVLHGIGVHHAGMLPRYRRLVERLTQRGLLAVVCGTDTLGVGINVPIRTVLFTSLIKFDGRKTRHLSAREFHQIAGRAGRAGYDQVGYVRVLASEAEVEQAKHRARLSAAQEEANTKKLKKLAKKTSPKSSTPGKISWTKGTFERLVSAEPEVLRSQFAVTHAMFLNVLAGPGDPEARLLALAQDNHDPDQDANEHLRSLGDIYRSLRQAGVITRLPHAEAQRQGVPRLQVVADLPDEFALNQPLAPFALAALDLLDPDSPDFTLDIISVIESVMEDPKPLLFAQERRAKDAAFHSMKAEGIEYDERAALLDQVTWPRPLAELIEPTFRVFSQTNPWVGEAEPSPKSVLREMIETAATFTGLIAKYDLHNAEGVILRYLTDLYRALRQIPPLSCQTPELAEVIDWLEKLVRSVDSSLLDEWERLNRGETSPSAGAGSGAGAGQPQDSGMEPAFGADPDGTVTYRTNPHLLQRDVRTAVFRLVEQLADDRVEQVASYGSDTGWDADRVDRALAQYWAEYDWMGIDHRARSAELFRVRRNPAVDEVERAVEEGGAQLEGSTDEDRWWLIDQVVLDPNEDGDWRVTLALDLWKTREEDRPHLLLLGFGPH